MIPLILDLLIDASLAQAMAGVLLLIGGAAFAICGLALSLIDLREHRLPNRIIYPWTGFTLALLVLVSLLLQDILGLARGLAAGLAWGIGFLLIRVISRTGLGMGDVKLAVVLGLYSGYLGWEVLASAVVLTFLLGGLLSLGLLITRRATASTHIPFGPFMVVGTAIALIIG